MAILNQKRILNLIPKTSAPVTIHVSQGDVGTEIEFTLVKGDELFVNTGSLSASVHGVREDGANFGVFTCTLSGSSVKFPLHAEMTAVKGSAIAEIVLVDSQGNKVGSSNFGIMVEESVFPLGVTYDNDVSVYESILAYAQTIPAQVQGEIADLENEVNSLNEALESETLNRINAISDEASARTNAVNNEASAREAADNVLDARIDQIVAPSGEAPSAAEVADARIGFDGVTYASVGTAVRTQANEMKNSYENSLEPIGIDLVITFINGGYVNTGSVDVGNVVSVTPTASSAYCYAIIPCQEGDKFTIKGASGASPRLYAFVDSTYHLVAKSEQALVGEYVAIAPATSAYIIINAGTSTEHYAFKGNNEFEPVRDKVNSGLYTNYAYLATEPGYIDDSGNVVSNPIINHSDFIEIPIGASAAILSNSYTWGLDKYNVVNPCIFYDSNKALISVIHAQTTDVVICTIPPNAKYVKINRPNVKRSDITARDNYFMFEALCNNRVYRVSKTALDADFSSVTECFLALKYDERPKTIEILDGDYDIFQEYKDCNVPVYTGNNPAMDFVPYCVFVPKNTHVIGKGIVRLIWMPTKESNPEITWMQCYAVSVINVMNSMTLENVELHCKNGRYCIHNDTIGTAGTAGTFQKYINVRCYKYENEVDTTTTPGESHVYGTNETTGYGVNVDAFHYYENCLFENEASGRSVQGHTNQRYEDELITQQQSGEIIFDRCVFETNGNQAIQLQNSGLTQHQHVRTKFLGCYMNKPMEIDGEGVHNAYDATFLDCGEVTLKINLTDNEYLPKAIRTELTLV